MSHQINSLIFCLLSKPFPSTRKHRSLPPRPKRRLTAIGDGGAFTWMRRRRRRGLVSLARSTSAIAQMPTGRVTQDPGSKGLRVDGSEARSTQRSGPLIARQANGPRCQGSTLQSGRPIARRCGSAFRFAGPDGRYAGDPAPAIADRCGRLPCPRPPEPELRFGQLDRS